MKKTAFFVIGLFLLLGLTSCRSGKDDQALLSRTFLATGWERFDFITKDLEIKRPTTYDLSMKVAFDPSYAYDYLSVVFTVFDSDDHPLRAKSYQFGLKEMDGSWKSELVDGYYTFTLPINSELAFPEPGMYKLQLESRMPITPLAGIHRISIIAN